MRTNEELSRIDPNAVPGLTPRNIGTIKHPDARMKVIKYDRMSLVLDVDPADRAFTNDKPIRTFSGKWTGDPDRKEIIAPEMLKVPQPHVGTCSRPGPGNVGCFAHNGCPYPNINDPMGRGPGPFNVVMEKDGVRDTCPCYMYYQGTARGRPTSQTSYGALGWKVDTSVTSTPSIKGRRQQDEFGNVAIAEIEIQNECAELGPCYGHHFGAEEEPPLDPVQLRGGDMEEKPREVPGRLQDIARMRSDTQFIKT